MAPQSPVARSIIPTKPPSWKEYRINQLLVPYAKTHEGHRTWRPVSGAGKGPSTEAQTGRLSNLFTFETLPIFVSNQSTSWTTSRLRIGSTLIFPFWVTTFCLRASSVELFLASWDIVSHRLLYIDILPRSMPFIFACKVHGHGQGVEIVTASISVSVSSICGNLLRKLAFGKFSTERFAETWKVHIAKRYDALPTFDRGKHDWSLAPLPPLRFAAIFLIASDGAMNPTPPENISWNY